MTASVPVSVARSGPTLNLSHALVCAVVVAAVASVPTWSNSYIVSVVVRALIFVMLGQAWNVIAGIGGQLSLGHGVFFGVGAYATALLFNQAGITSWIGLWIAALIAAACAVVIGLATMRSRDVYFALGTVVISLDFEKVARFMVDLTGDDAGLAVNYRGTAPAVMQFRDPPPAFLWIDLVVVLAFYLFTRWLLRSPFGLRLQAVRDDEHAAAASGVKVLGVKLSGLVISAMMTAVAGALHVQFYLSIDPGTALGLFQGIQIQLPALIGGLGTALGPVVGSVVATLLSEGTNWGATALGIQGGDILVYGVALLLVVLYAPRRHRRPVPPPAAPCRRTRMTHALEVTGIEKNFGGLEVLKGVSFHVEPGEILGLIGPNGAGKSTLFEIIGGAMRPVKGRISYMGQDITVQPAHARRRAGLCRTFQKIRLFDSLTVAQNITFAASESPPQGRTIQADVEGVLALLDLTRLRDKLPGDLTLAERKRVEIARAIAGTCRLLMLDESLSGLTNDEAQELIAAVRMLSRERGIAIVLVEHLMPVVMALAQRLIVLHFGRVVASGAPAEIVNNPVVIEAYLGKQEVVA